MKRSALQEQNKLEKSQILASPWGHSKKLLFYFVYEDSIENQEVLFHGVWNVAGRLVDWKSSDKCDKDVSENICLEYV